MRGEAGEASVMKRRCDVCFQPVPPPRQPVAEASPVIPTGICYYLHHLLYFHPEYVHSLAVHGNSQTLKQGFILLKKSEYCKTKVLCNVN